jgi:molybdopterin biosynthesis enzyme
MSEASPLTTAQQVFAAAVPFRAVAEESCSLADAVGRTLYHDVIAPTDMPPYHRAIVEGFIVHTQDTASASEENPASFSIAGAIKPGDEQCPQFNQGEAMEVVTGVVVPDGPYSVVRMWEAKREDDRFSITRPFPPRFFIEDQACDLNKGDVVVPAGTVIGAAELGAVAALGITHLQVAGRPQVTYDQTLRPGLIRDSNSVMLCAAVGVEGGDAYCGGILRDDFDVVVAAARSALAKTDMLVFSGGTAAGGGDFISNVIKAVG